MNASWIIEDRQRLVFRAAYRGEAGDTFLDHLHHRSREHTGSEREARALAQRSWAVICEVDNQQDDARKAGDETPITPAAYAARWRVPERSAYRAFREVVDLLGHHPGLVADELWDALAIQQGGHEMMRLGAVVVVPR